MARFDESEKIAVFREGRTIFIFDDIDGISAAECFKLFKVLEQEGKAPITIIINSSGGEVYSGLALYDRIKTSPCKVVMIGTGFVASIALIIYLAGDERLITPNTVLLNHQAWGEVSGRADDIKIEAKEFTRIENIVTNIISSITGQPGKKIKEDIKRGDKYITPAEALTTGYAHKMIEHTTKTPTRKRK